MKRIRVAIVALAIVGVIRRVTEELNHSRTCLAAVWFKRNCFKTFYVLLGV